jgi:hypothetical protein
MPKRQTAANKIPIGFHFLVLILTLTLISVSCTSPSSPDDDTTEGVANIVILNDYGKKLDIYLDGVFQFLIGNNETKEIEDVTKEEHQLEAKLAGTNNVAATYEVDVTSVGDYVWNIDDPADIIIQNISGFTMKIYMDGVYLFDLVDEENRWILDVTWAEHYLKAEKKNDGSEYASTTIEVTENKDYTWLIE